ncbi:MAG: nitroreductase family deazaflavin-dependent oxidoreductase [Roseiflexaceae bacterium]|nr:nitroreductase family deazaflavin-dependent oxidoreductase [Roseiflexaceae bacterium]
MQSESAIGSYGRPYPRSAARAQRLVTDLHLAAYRLSGGRLGGTLLGMPMLLLSTWGRKTGLLRTAPLLYLPAEGALVLVASNGGAQRSPTWFYNLEANPHALVQVGPARGEVISALASETQRARLWPQLLDVYAGYASYQARTDRQIPVVLLYPQDNRMLH